MYVFPDLTSRLGLKNTVPPKLASPVIDSTSLRPFEPISIIRLDPDDKTALPSIVKVSILPISPGAMVPAMFVRNGEFRMPAPVR